MATWILTGSPENFAELVLDEPDWVPAEELAGELEHCASGPRSTGRWRSRDRVRTVSDHDAELIRERMSGERAHA